MVPPQDLDLERSVLSGLIFSAEVEILDSLKPEYFYRTAHRIIFTACRSVWRSEKSLDVKLLVSALKGDLEQIGGVSFLATLSNDPPPSNTELYCKKLQQLYQLRKIIEVSNAVNKRAFKAVPAESDNILGFAASELMKISLGAASDWRSLGEVLVECVDHCEDIAKLRGVTGVNTGFMQIDYLTAGFQGGDLIILAARPGCGKTAFAVNASRNAAMSGFKNAFQSLEMARISIGNRYLSAESRINLLKFRRGDFNSQDWDDIQLGAGRLADLQIWIDDRPRASVYEIAKACRILKMRDGLDILWIDYLGYIDGEKQSRSKVLEIESITRGLKALAKELNIPVVLICQLNRECEKRDNKRPQLSDLRDSGAIEQDADLVLFLYKDSKYNKESLEKNIVECEIAKHRNGPEGTVKLYWADEYARFDNLEVRDEPPNF